MEKNIINTGDQPLDGKHRSEQRQVVKQKVLTGRLIKRPGQTVYEFNLATEECKAALIEETKAVLGNVTKGTMQTGVNIHHTVKQREGCLYCASINKKNAIRKFKNMLDKLVKNGVLIKV
jgi:hypothetical protein